MSDPLLQIPLLAGLPASQLAQVRPHLRELHHAAGAPVLRQGEPNATFHLIRSGQVAVFLEGEPRVRVATLGPGEFFGEMACLTGDRASATVEAVVPTVTVALDRDGLLALMDVSPPLRRQVLAALVQRIRNANVRVQAEHGRATEITRVMQRDGEARYGELLGEGEAMQQVRAQLAQLAAAATPVAILGEDGTGKEHAAARLHYGGPRRDGPFLVLGAAEFHWDAWDRQLRAASGGTLVLKRADLLTAGALRRVVQGGADVRVVLTAPDLPAVPGLARVVLPPLRERKEDIPALVRVFLRRSGVADPAGAMAGEALRRLLIYPFLAGNVKELARVIREAVVLAAGGTIRPEHLRLGRYRPPGARPTVGLALGGGAVRGCAHVGVLKVLEQAAIPVDLIAGTSAGALVGALYAGGMGVAEMERLLPTLKWRDLLQWTWPRQALAHNAPLARWLERHLGRVTFADLRLPFAAMAADARSGTAVVLRSGPVAEAVRASTALPGLMRPVQVGERTLVDGGVVHKVPAALARSMGADLVIAVDVGVPAFAAGPARNLLDALLHAFDIMSERLVSEELEWADVVLRPRAPVSGYSFKNAAAFFQRGAAEAEPAVPLVRRRMAELAAGAV